MGFFFISRFFSYDIFDGVLVVWKTNRFCPFIFFTAFSFQFLYVCVLLVDSLVRILIHRANRLVGLPLELRFH